MWKRSWELIYCCSWLKGTFLIFHRLVAEVEVGGWPVPTVTWFKDEDILTSKTHTENYNGFPNKYVPDSRIEVIRLDQIRHCVIFNRISESDSGLYTVQAVNPLGEAVCEAEFLVVPGEPGMASGKLPESLHTVDNKKTHPPCFSTFHFSCISPEPLEVQ